MIELFEGNRAKIYLIDYYGKKAVLKKLRAGKPDTLKKEVQILRTLDRFAPKIYEWGPGYIVMEYVDGISFKEAVKRDFKRSVRLALDACYYLDQKGVYHKELGRYHHLLFAKDLSWVKVIDFERAVVRSNPRNVLQFIGFYLRAFDLRKEIELYKKDKKAGYKALLRALDV